MMDILFIGGTGNISSAVSRLCVEKGFNLTLATRCVQAVHIEGAHMLQCNITDKAQAVSMLANRTWDVVVDWIAYTPDEIARDIELFEGKTKQFIFISSASAYQKPPVNYFITESTPLSNPFWEYSRNKIACEELLISHFRQTGFPCTIVRPSHTYDTVIPIAIGGWHEYTAVNRIKNGLPVISHGDGNSLWVLTHAKDFAKGFAGLLGNTRSIGQSYHITSDEVLSWDQIYYAIGDAVGKKPQIVHISSDFIAKIEPSFYGELHGDKACSVVFDNTKIKRLVPSFICEIPFALGIRSTVEWFERDEKRCRSVPQTDALIEKILKEYESL